MRKLIPCCCLLWMLLACAARAGAEDALFALRSQGYGFMSNLMFSFDPYEKYPVPEYRDAYREALRRLAELAPDAGMGALVEALRESTAELERQPLAVVQGSYPEWIDPLLQRHAQLDRLAGQLQDSRGQAPGASGRLQRLSLLNSQILLLYQTRAAQLYAMHVEFSEDAFDLLDGQIMRLFAELRTAPEAWREPLARAQRDYQFVRPQIRDGSRRAAAEGVGFYLRRVISRLDRLQGAGPGTLSAQAPALPEH